MCTSYLIRTIVQARWFTLNHIFRKYNVIVDRLAKMESTILLFFFLTKLDHCIVHVEQPVWLCEMRHPLTFVCLMFLHPAFVYDV